MDKTHEEACCDSTSKRSKNIEPHVLGVDLPFKAQRVHVANLVSSLSKTKGWIEATSTYRACELDHGIERY